MTSKSWSAVIAAAVAMVMSTEPGCAAPRGAPTIPSDYVAAHDGRHEVLIPECFELANVILVLTAWGAADEAGNFFLATDYHDAVARHFAPYREHPLFAALSGVDFDRFNDFVGFRENSFAYSFVGDRLVRTAPFPSWWNPENLPDHFTANLARIEDFARRSGFREVYRRHRDLYEREIAELAELVDLEDPQPALRGLCGLPRGPGRAVRRALAGADDRRSVPHDPHLGEELQRDA